LPRNLAQSCLIFVNLAQSCSILLNLAQSCSILLKPCSDLGQSWSILPDHDLAKSWSILVNLGQSCLILLNLGQSWSILPDHDLAKSCQETLPNLAHSCNILPTVILLNLAKHRSCSFLQVLER
jgi:hypothetical protein